MRGVTNALARQFSKRLAAYNPKVFFDELGSRLDKHLGDLLDGLFEIAKSSKTSPGYRLRAIEMLLEYSGNPTLVREAAKSVAKGKETESSDDEDDEESKPIDHFAEVRRRKKKQRDSEAA